MNNKYTIAAFYRFASMASLEEKKEALLEAMGDNDVFGTIIIAEEGYNGTISTLSENFAEFARAIDPVLGPDVSYRRSSHTDQVFKRRKIKIKNEIVTLRKDVNLGPGKETRVGPKEWNDLVNEPDTVLIDARNDYEYKIGTFEGSLNPGTDSFSELPEFIEKNFDPAQNPKIAMFCTGGIRCEKLAPYLIENGFERVFQLDGGILNYLEKMEPEESLWTGECFVFDERVTVDTQLRKGTAEDLSAAK